MMYDMVLVSLLLTHLLEGPCPGAQTPHEHHPLPKHCGPAGATRQSEFITASNDPAPAAASLQLHNNHVPVNQCYIKALVKT